MADEKKPTPPPPPPPPPKTEHTKIEKGAFRVQSPPRSAVRSNETIVTAPQAPPPPPPPPTPKQNPQTSTTKTEDKK